MDFMNSIIKELVSKPRYQCQYWKFLNDTQPYIYCIYQPRIMWLDKKVRENFVSIAEDYFQGQE